MAVNRATIDTESIKTGKVYLSRPLPSAIIPALKSYVAGQIKRGLSLDTRLIPDKNIRHGWETIREKAKLPNITRQDLRVTFSTLIQKIGSIGAAQNLLEHSDSRVTETFYSDMELLLRWRVNQLPVKEWLKGL